MEPAEAVLKFLASVGPGDQVEFYLRLFRSRPGPSFAVLAVDEAALESSGDSVAVDLRFLHALELIPCVVLGLHEPARALEHRDRLAERLREDGVPAELGATDQGAQAAAGVAAGGAIPLLCASGEDEEARLWHLSRLLDGLQTHKLIFLRQAGGLRGDEGERIDVVSLTPAGDAPVPASQLGAAEERIVRQARRLVFELVGHRLQIAMTSPLNLLHELFTVKGAGTLLRRAAEVLRHEGYAGVDAGRLADLLEASFGRPAKPSFFERPVAGVYLERAYRGVAIVEDAPLWSYVTKFAVTRQAQGEGIGQDLWHALRNDHQALTWRARRDNPVRGWYERICNSRVDEGEWTVYMWGVPTERIPAAVAHALDQPIDLVDGP